MKLPPVDSIETLSLAAMRRLVTGLVGKMHELEAEVGVLRTENQNLRAKVESLELENKTLRLENQQLRDEISRLKKLPPRPPFKTIRHGEGGAAEGWQARHAQKPRCQA
jgi:hypothetical protein